MRRTSALVSVIVPWGVIAFAGWFYSQGGGELTPGALTRVRNPRIISCLGWTFVVLWCIALVTLVRGLQGRRSRSVAVNAGLLFAALPIVGYICIAIPSAAGTKVIASVRAADGRAYHLAYEPWWSVSLGVQVSHTWLFLTTRTLGRAATDTNYAAPVTLPPGTPVGASLVLSTDGTKIAHVRRFDTGEVRMNMLYDIRSRTFYSNVGSEHEDVGTLSRTVLLDRSTTRH